MHIRRVVTGRAPDGRSVVLSDGATPRTVAFQSIPGHAFAQVWTTPPLPVLSASSADPTNRQTGLLPPTGGTSLLIVVFPPDSTMSAPGFDPAAAGAECVARMPDLAQTFEPDCPGMHATDTVDYAIVLSGEIWLEVDDGQETLLRPTDVVVQQGTRHAWRNKGDAPSTVAFFMVGATRP
ncbi:cupin domain-containing protein [Burkholderia sp. SCN-KJ]|uniref:cupin domain-containing protein n=1 Tax=Burkholderia sp. SCN-KJ TaxID=2969248 RepID=UPI0021503873|nr:cupin domain-containing protein [Burkholderia sp. SCN-KJ]MCR4467864.1 cupin domain-containing protein [Burkholderia sp. SCN-KJ]